MQCASSNSGQTSGAGATRRCSPPPDPAPCLLVELLGNPRQRWYQQEWQEGRSGSNVSASASAEACACAQAKLRYQLEESERRDERSRNRVTMLVQVSISTRILG